MAQTQWKPNPTQQKFLETLKGADGKTLGELSEIAGVKFQTGTINTLTTKGLIKTEDVTIECNVVRKDNGKVVGTTKKKVKAYFLVQED